MDNTTKKIIAALINKRNQLNIKLPVTNGI
jgi:hypothetical protein